MAHMRALVPALVLFAAGCAGVKSTDLQPLSTPEVCYIGMVSPEYRQPAFDEVARRHTSCEHYTAEIRAIDQTLRQRAAEKAATAAPSSTFAASPAGFSHPEPRWRRAR